MLQYNTAEQNDSSASENAKQDEMYLVELKSVVVVHTIEAQSVGQWADTRSHAVYGVVLRPLAWWECGFESLRGHR
jgi:hypothetical protein